MNAWTIPLGLILASYLLGSVPFGLILSKLFARIDIRQHGSHNIGATNVYRNLGKKLGALTLCCDILKGFLPVFVVRQVTGSDEWTALAALAAFLGHLYPVYLRFSGGKGVATAVGAYIVLAPTLLLGGFLVFALVLALSRYVSLSSITAAVVIPLFMSFLADSYSQAYLLVAVMFALMITYRHKENLKRLKAGQESKIGSKKNVQH